MLYLAPFIRYCFVLNNLFTHSSLALGCIPPPYCSGEFKAAWWTRSPYLTNSSSQEPVGLFKDLLKQVVVSCCANCSLLSFVGPYNGSFDVEAAIEANNSVDFGCPLYGSPDQTLFRGYPYMSVGRSNFLFFVFLCFIVLDLNVLLVESICLRI